MTSTLARPTAGSIDLEIDRLGPGFGAEVRGVDLATAGDETVAAVRQALTEHKVLFFAGQGLDPDRQVALGNRMGRLTVSHPVVPGIDEAHLDNRATVHYANHDYGTARRVMHRITLRGDEPVGVDVLR